MAQRKNYYPNRVSRNERLAYQLLEDRKIDVINFRKKGNKTNNYLVLGDFILRRRGEPIHVVDMNEENKK